jgi:ABC-type tungstate transport system permease subunit
MTEIPAVPHPSLHQRREPRFATVHALFAAALFVAIAALLLRPALASADSSSTLTGVGTSDLSDSGLSSNLIQKDFEQAYPQYTFKYIHAGTGTAIAEAESGSQGASVLIVHSPPLENQFVAKGYSYEQYGRAIFTNDFVLGGPKGDPAGVAANGAHNVAQAFADIAAAGINGKATLVSRGGTPGTTVEEHKIWGLVSSAHLVPAGLLLCAVNSTDGGGETPIAAGNGVTSSGQPCPNNGVLPTGGQLPKWYVVTGAEQGPNVLLANTCAGYPSGANSCYVLTDRGTYDYLASGTDPAGAIPNLMIVTRDDSASAPGGQYALINYFHAYIINPSKPGEQVNFPAAKDLLNMLTSPSFQAQLKSYLAHTSDPGGAPFKADASPIITAAGIPRSYRAGRRVTVTGTVTNAEPGYPALADKTVSVDEIVGGVPVPVASGKTDATGGYRLTFRPTSSGSYEVGTPQIAQIEEPTLTPVFGDLLSPGAAAPVKVTVHSAITTLSVKSVGGKALVVGSVAPAQGHVKASVTVLARRAGSKGRFKRVATGRLRSTAGNFAVAAPLHAGHWQLEVRFKDPKQVLATSRKVKVTVGGEPVTGVTLGSARVKHGTLSMTGSVSKPAGGKVEALAMSTTSGPARFRVLGTAKLGARDTKFSFHGKLRRGTWVLGLEYVPNGHPPSLSKLRTATAH